MNILGIAFLSDASACILKDGKLIAAVSEERLNRTKLWNGFPELSIKEVLRISGLDFEQIDYVATHGKTTPEPNYDEYSAKEYLIKNAPLDSNVKEHQISALWSRYEHEKKVMGERTPKKLNDITSLGKKTFIYGHHEAHAASAYYASQWDQCYVLTADGWGEDGSSTLWKADNGKMSLLSKSNTFDSLGYMYGSITEALGFLPHRHEGKILGLAAYCSHPKSYEIVKNMMDYDKKNKRFVGKLENGYYIPHFKNSRIHNIVKNYEREDWSSAVQKRLEELVCECINDIDDQNFSIALAGGIFANVKLNQRIRELKKVNDVYIFPNMGDGGLSVGAAYLAYHQITQTKPEAIYDVYLGADIEQQEVENEIKKNNLNAIYYENIEEKIAELLAQNEIVSVCKGRMEFGPRALGHRSILFHAGDASVNQWLNQQLERSEFMPFAPATLEEKASEYYIGINTESEPAKYMTMTYDCTEKMLQEAPAAVHIDKTARPQLISEKRSPIFYKILKKYNELTGLATVINTSFNMHEEPIVHSAADAVRAFIAGNLPNLALGNYLIKKK